MIFDADREIFICVTGENQTAEIVFDGETHVLVDENSAIRVTKNRDIAISFVKFKKDAFYDILSQKIK